MAGGWYSGVIVAPPVAAVSLALYPSCEPGRVLIDPGLSASWGRADMTLTGRGRLQMTQCRRLVPTSNRPAGAKRIPVV